MKMITFFITLLLSVAMLRSSCSVTGNREKTLLGNPVVKVPTLLDKTNWTTDTIANGIICYNFAAKDEVSDASQIVNVLWRAESLYPFSGDAKISTLVMFEGQDNERKET